MPGLCFWGLTRAGEGLDCAAMKTLKFNSGKGSKEQVLIGRFVCDRYAGEFQVATLQAKADTGLWYARAQGTGIGLEGEGASPEGAVFDLRKRAADLRAEIDRVYFGN